MMMILADQSVAGKQVSCKAIGIRANNTLMAFCDNDDNDDDDDGIDRSICCSQQVSCKAIGNSQ